MSTPVIKAIKGRQILDSRGRPTVEVDVLLNNGELGRASIPSGASTGAAEAHELRDGDTDNYQGLSVLKAVSHVNTELNKALSGVDPTDQWALDRRMTELDGTDQLSNLGANAILGVSLAACRAVAQSNNKYLYEWIAELTGTREPTMPMPMVNILSGGLHVRNGMDVQDFLAIPARATSVKEAIQFAADIRTAAAEIMSELGLTTLLADEGGLSPGFKSPDGALQLMVEAFERAGLEPGKDAGIALDVAASAFTQPDGTYALKREGKILNGEEMIALMENWVRKYPVVSIEDGLGEEAWDGWKTLTEKLGHEVQLVGDDLFTTNKARLSRGIEGGIANGVLVKVNQNGTLSGTLDVIASAKAAGYAPVVSARSGETEDHYIADIAVGTAAGQIKIGSIRTSDRLAKYNQLLRIEEFSSAPFAGTSAFTGKYRMRKSSGVTKPKPQDPTVTPELTAFIYNAGLAPRNSKLVWTPLMGGISSDIWRLDTDAGSICIKRALEKLRVAADWHAPVNRNNFEWEWLHFAAEHAPANVPELLAHDSQLSVFAMAYLDADDYPVWKSQLMAGRVDSGIAQRVGTILSRLHQASANSEELAKRFDSTDNFYALRLEPYFVSLISRYPKLAETMQTLVSATMDTRIVLVHGDISPKNILVSPAGEPIILDAECAWYGDPAFDVAFLLNHMLLKCLVNPNRQEAYLECFETFWNNYKAGCGWENAEALEQRAAALLPAMLLARIDGKSPVEYLNEESQKIMTREVAVQFLVSPSSEISDIKAAWQRGLGSL